MSATWAVEIQIFWPDSDQPPSVRSARVAISVVFSPASGSVTAKHAFCSPRISGGSMRAFCCSVPNTTTGCRPKMFMCTDDAPAMAAPDSATARIITAASVMPRLEPPNASGIAMPSSPASAMARWNSSGNAASLSLRSQ